LQQKLNFDTIFLGGDRKMVDRIAITLKAARVNAGLTQKKAAKLLEISQNKLIHWERDPQIVNLREQRKISRAYDIPIDNIFFGKK